MRFQRQPLRTASPRNLYFLSFFNVFFIILMFIVFLPTLSAPAGLPIALPRVVSSEAVSSDGAVIFVLKDNAIYFDSKKISFEELKRLLTARKKGSQVLIKADQAASVGTLVRVWDLLREAGISQVNIATNE
jgi:biopolymer transport protein ExbD